MAFTTADTATPGASPRDSTASRVSRETMRKGPLRISTWALTRSFTTRTTIPGNRLRADSREVSGSSVGARFAA